MHMRITITGDITEETYRRITKAIACERKVKMQIRRPAATSVCVFREESPTETDCRIAASVIRDFCMHRDDREPEADNCRLCPIRDICHGEPYTWETIDTVEERGK